MTTLGERGVGTKTKDGVLVHPGDMVWIFHPRRGAIQTEVKRFSDRCVGVTDYLPFFSTREHAIREKIRSLRSMAAKMADTADELEKSLANGGEV